MRLAKISQQSGIDIYVNPAQVVMVVPAKTGQATMIQMIDKTQIVCKDAAADVVKELDAAMK